MGRPIVTKPCLNCPNIVRTNRSKFCSRSCCKQYNFYARIVNGVECKLCADCQNFVPVGQFREAPSARNNPATGRRSTCAACEQRRLAPFRKCTKCRCVRLLANFSNSKSGKFCRSSICRDCIRLKSAAYQSIPANKEKALETGRRWKARNKIKCGEYSRRGTNKLRLETITAYGGKCKCCGESQPEFLTIDHIFNDGATDRKTLFRSKRTGGTSMYSYLKRNGWPKDRYQLLCYNCNCAKGFIGECPHAAKRRLLREGG